MERTESIKLLALMASTLLASNPNVLAQSDEEIKTATNRAWQVAIGILSCDVDGLNDVLRLLDKI